jgi:predicted Zn-ribbon and HTH transcriptional regulator
MRWPGIESLYGPSLRKTPVFSTEIRWEHLHTRVIEHVREACKIMQKKFTPELTIPLECPSCGRVLQQNYVVSPYSAAGSYTKGN